MHIFSHIWKKKKTLFFFFLNFCIFMWKLYLSCDSLGFKIVIEPPGSKLHFNMFTLPTTLFVCSKHRSHFHNVRESFSHEVYDSCTNQQKGSCSWHFPQRKWIYIISILHISFLGIENPRGMRKKCERRYVLNPETQVQ